LTAAAPDNHLTKLADVVPFRGLRYNREAVEDLSLVVSPPYDIISPAEQERYHHKHPLNAIHLDYGLDLPGDSESENRYSRAAGFLQKWLAEQVLAPEARPAFYLCREEFVLGDGSTGIREGFIGLVRLEDFSRGVVLPHEETASGPKADRLRLMEATEANLSAIYCLYRDPGHTVIDTLKSGVASEPQIRITDEAGTVHSLWVADDPEATAAVNQSLSAETLLIADGHHRYETALAYRDARRAKDGPGPDQPYDFLMVYLSDMGNTSQSILPIHRFVSGLMPKTIQTLIPSLLRDFDLLQISDGNRARQMLDALAGTHPDRNTFGMYLSGPDEYFILNAKQPRPMIDSAMADGKSAAYRSLDVAVLDRLILASHLGIREGGSNQDAKVRFVERTEKALAELTAPGFDVAFLLNPTSMEEIKAVADAGEKMPQKSTYFYPKPLTGLVFRSFQY